MKAMIAIGVSATAAIVAVVAIVMINNAMTTSTNDILAQAEEPGRIELSLEPVYRERAPPGAVTPINQTHISATHSGEGTLTLPDGTKTNTTSSGTAVLSFATSSADAISVIRTENGDTMTATIHEIIQFNDSAIGGGRGIMIVILHTNSTGALAPFNGMILAGTDIIYPNGESDTQLWRWESGKPLSNTTTGTVS